jgi:hypothetical protein
MEVQGLSRRYEVGETRSYITSYFGKVGIGSFENVE